MKNPQGKVYLVGAGPGDPGLLTLKARACLEEADVVVYDNLANRSFLDYARPEAECIYVGKKGGCHAKTQGEINAIIVDRARRGRVVVRLKGGDPFIFGRGGEEAEELVGAGVRFEVVPGVTSAIAVPAYAGIPLTHRKYTSTVAFITGHEDPLKEDSSIPWDRLSTGAGTLVFLMGVGNLAKITRKLMEHGRPPETPVAVIQQGTLNGQQTVTGTLEDIASKAESRGIRPPSIIVVGEVVGLRAQLAWFEKRPLFGRKIVVTRAREQASGFLKVLTSLGADCVEFPTIQVVPPRSWKELDARIEALETYDWLVFTSVNGVRFFLERLEALGRDVRDLHGLKIAAIGPKTAETFVRMGIRPDLVPAEYRAEAVAEGFRKWPVEGVRILLPRAAEARSVLPDALSDMGARVDVVAVYRTVKPKEETGKVRDLLKNGAVDMVTFTSSSTVKNFLDMFKEDLDVLMVWMKRVAVACIGPVSAETAERNGLDVAVMPAEYTIEGLTREIVHYFESTDRGAGGQKLGDDDG